MTFAKEMTSASKKYQVTLAIITAAFVALLAVGHLILTPVAEGPMFWAFIYIPFLGTAALTLTGSFKGQTENGGVSD
ncbi:MAG: hypothetical protein KBG39_03445 [Opitutaceae bacterium]|nr:hypothetical protein [Opitutaceae bacterium]